MIASNLQFFYECVGLYYIIVENVCECFVLQLKEIKKIYLKLKVISIPN